MSHTCDAFVLTCMDFRFHPHIRSLLREKGIETFDLKSDAGGVKFLVSDAKPEVRGWILENISIAIRLHHVAKVVLINHFDCGAYGGNESFESDEKQQEFQSDQLKQALKIVKEKFPEMGVFVYIAKIKDNVVTLLEV